MARNRKKKFNETQIYLDGIALNDEMLGMYLKKYRKILRKVICQRLIYYITDVG